MVVTYLGINFLQVTLKSKCFRSDGLSRKISRGVRKLVWTLTGKKKKLGGKWK